MAHSIVTNVCEGIADCVNACPVACIHDGPGKNTLGTDWYWIDFNICIDCGICIQVCPIEGAILPEERPDLQATPSWLFQKIEFLSLEWVTFKSYPLGWLELILSYFNVHIDNEIVKISIATTELIFDTKGVVTN